MPFLIRFPVCCKLVSFFFGVQSDCWKGIHQKSFCITNAHRKTVRRSKVMRSPCGAFGSVFVKGFVWSWWSAVGQPPKIGADLKDWPNLSDERAKSLVRSNALLSERNAYRESIGKNLDIQRKTHEISYRRLGSRIALSERSAIGSDLDGSAGHLVRVDRK